MFNDIKFPRGTQTIPRESEKINQPTFKKNRCDSCLFLRDGEYCSQMLSPHFRKTVTESDTCDQYRPCVTRRLLKNRRV